MSLPAVARVGRLVGRLRLDRAISLRAAVVAAIYGGSALLLLATVVLLRRAVSPADLRAVLGFFFVSSTAAGLDPGTVKAAALQPRGAAAGSCSGFMLASAVKALAAGPVLGLVWRFAEPQTPWGVLAWLPLVCVAGFVVTDMRVILDLEGRHGAALGLKQGLTVGGHALAGLLVVLGAGLPAAIGVSTLARLTVAAVVAIRLDGGARRSPWPDARAALRDLRWVDFAGASALAAASGSADRVIGLRYLPAGAYGAYYITFEALSRFWLIPYLLTPILFARSVAGRDAKALADGAWIFTGVAGAGLVTATGALFVLAPAVVPALVGAKLALPTLALAVAVVLGGFAQLRIAQLQAAGWSRLVMGITGVMGLVSAAVFLVGALRWGAAGLMCAWAIRAAVELALVLGFGSARRGPGADRWTAAAPAVGVGSVTSPESIIRGDGA